MIRPTLFVLAALTFPGLAFAQTVATDGPPTGMPQLDLPKTDSNEVPTSLSLFAQEEVVMVSVELSDAGPKLTTSRELSGGPQPARGAAGGPSRWRTQVSRQSHRAGGTGRSRQFRHHRSCGRSVWSGRAHGGVGVGGLSGTVGLLTLREPPAAQSSLQNTVTSW